MSTHRSAWKRVPSLWGTMRAFGARFAIGVLSSAALLVLTADRVTAEPAAPAAEPRVGLPPATPRIALLTMGPGDDFVTKFGHDALVVAYPGEPARVYNFGMYTRESITITRVLSGHLRYWLAVVPYADTITGYRRQNRSLLSQELQLDPTAARALAAALAENARPENASYRYDYALDNCTTRVRDALDRATGGALRRTLAGAPVETTYREHALRLTAGDPLLSLLFDLGLGAPADRPLSGWDDAYLPDRLAAAVRRVKLTTYGVERPLVQRELLLFQAARPPVRERAPSRWGWMLGSGLLLTAVMFASARSQRRGVRAAGAAVAALTSFAVGALGLVLTGLLLTQVHAVVRPNVNVLFCSPLALCFVPALVHVALGRTLSTRRAQRWALASSVIAVIGALATFFVGQKSAHLALLFVPYWWGLWCLLRAATVPAGALATIRRS
jgi:hypothetical protein